MFDLTKNIKLNSIAEKKYKAARLGLYAVFGLGVLFTADKILFPSQTLNLFFDNLNAAKNTIVNPRLGGDKTLSKGIIPGGENFAFNANPLGNFSSVQATFQTADNQDLSGSQISVRKSYQAFFYPEGKPLGFKSGSLLTTENAEYYLVSKGMLRRFASPEIILSLGFPKSAFVLVSQDDLKYNQAGPDITSGDSYPDDTLFLIDDKFYQLLNGKLSAFVSDRAFLSQYQSVQAIAKTKDIFSTYPQTENPLGFADATLASNAGSVFILSGAKSYPVADFNTFEAMGFNWKNVKALESDELGAYEQQKQFTVNQPHPDGTIFQDENKQQYFIIDNGLKRPILSQAVLNTYPSENMIAVDQDGSSKKVSCVLQKQILPFKTYSCQMDLSEISTSKGNDYQFETSLKNTAKLKESSLAFSTPLSWKNAMNSLSKIKGNLQSNYNAN